MGVSRDLACNHGRRTALIGSQARIVFQQLGLELCLQIACQFGLVAVARRPYLDRGASQMHKRREFALQENPLLRRAKILSADRNRREHSNAQECHNSHSPLQIHTLLLDPRFTALPVLEYCEFSSGRCPSWLELVLQNRANRCWHW